MGPKPPPGARLVNAHTTITKANNSNTMSNILFQPTTCIHCQGPLPEDREMGNFCSMPCFQAFDHSNGDLHDYKSGMYIRPATLVEAETSAVVAIIDGGHGIILVDGISCYVQL